MFKFLKKFFQPEYQKFTIRINALTCSSWYELYQKVGADKVMDKEFKRTGKLTGCDAFLMNEKTLEGIRKIIERNFRAKNKKKMFPKMIEWQCGVDYITYSPKACEKVPDCEMWLNLKLLGKREP